jgi:tetratricopeptide (TPR) repeat protein
MTTHHLNKNILVIAFILLIALVGVYSNHFDNGFHFDDSHCVVNNIYIRDVKNIPLFFKDATTFSSLPQNQSYRPMVTTSYAIDYWLAGNKLDPFYFHLDMFIGYVLLCVLLYFLFLYIFNKTIKHRWNSYAALFATAFFAFHTVNAETVNYVSARSDLFSTFWLLLGLVMYFYIPLQRKYYLYFIPVFIGLLYKPPALMFAPILTAYLWLFIHECSVSDALSPEKWKKHYTIIFAALPAWILFVALYIFQDKMTPETWSPGNTRFNFIITQPYVVLQYIKAFFLPLHLSADTDLSAFKTVNDPRFLAGIITLGIVIFLAVFTSGKKQLRPVSFGILWYVFALVPSSSIIPLAEVLNDHRMFFPNIGMVMAVVWSATLLVYKYEKEITSTILNKTLIFSLMFIILSGHAYGTYQRNKVWNDSESLWYDVTIKSPKNGRGLMNYGLRMMEKGDYPNAEKYYQEALKYNPYYSYLHINLGVLYSATNRKAEAEEYFKNATGFDSKNPEVHYFYGNFLFNQKRFAEALPKLKKSIELASAHINSRHTLMELYYETGDFANLKTLANETLAFFPDDATSKQYLEMAATGKNKLTLQEEETYRNPSAPKFLDLSLKYYQVGNYEKCILAAQEALKINPKFAEAYNNICSAYNGLKKYKEAENACLKALELKPDFSLAKGNLNAARTAKKSLEQSAELAKKSPTAENYLNLSLTYYNNGLYKECVEACKMAVTIKPDMYAAYNNMCSAYTLLKEYDKAIEACEKALRIKPDFQLAKNNLNWAANEKKSAHR